MVTVCLLSYVYGGLPPRVHAKQEEYAPLTPRTEHSFKDRIAETVRKMRQAYCDTGLVADAVAEWGDLHQELEAYVREQAPGLLPLYQETAQKVTVMYTHLYDRALPDIIAQDKTMLIEHEFAINKAQMRAQKQRSSDKRERQLQVVRIMRHLVMTLIDMPECR